MEPDTNSQPSEIAAQPKPPAPNRWRPARRAIGYLITAALLTACSAGLCGLPANVSYWSGTRIDWSNYAREDHSGDEGDASNQDAAPMPDPQPIRQVLPPPAVASDEPEEIGAVATLPNASLLGIGCLAGGQHLISFEFDQTISGGYIVTVGDQPFQLAPVPDQPARLYFVGPTLFPNQQVEVRLLSPLGQTVFSQNYLLPACAEQPAAPQVAVQPNCPPPEFFDPLMNRCRIVGNEQPAQPEYSPPSDYTPPGDY